MSKRLVLGLMLALALRELSRPATLTGETEGRRICPVNATAVRSALRAAGVGGFDSAVAWFFWSGPSVDRGRDELTGV